MAQLNVPRSSPFLASLSAQHVCLSSHRTCRITTTTSVTATSLFQPALARANRRGRDGAPRARAGNSARAPARGDRARDRGRGARRRARAARHLRARRRRREGARGRARRRARQRAPGARARRGRAVRARGRAGAFRGPCSSSLRRFNISRELLAKRKESDAELATDV